MCGYILGKQPNTWCGMYVDDGFGACERLSSGANQRLRNVFNFYLSWAPTIATFPPAWFKNHFSLVSARPLTSFNKGRHWCLTTCNPTHTVLTAPLHQRVSRVHEAHRLGSKSEPSCELMKLRKGPRAVAAPTDMLFLQI